MYSKAGCSFCGKALNSGRTVTIGCVASNPACHEIDVYCSRCATIQQEIAENPVTLCIHCNKSKNQINANKQAQPPIASGNRTNVKITMFVPTNSPVQYLKELSQGENTPIMASFGDRQYSYYFSDSVPNGIICTKQVNVYCVQCKHNTKTLASQFTDAASKITQRTDGDILNLIIAYHPSSDDRSSDNCVEEPQFLEMFPFMKKTIHFHNKLAENTPQAFFKAVDDWVIKNASAPLIYAGI